MASTPDGNGYWLVGLGRRDLRLRRRRLLRLARRLAAQPAHRGHGLNPDGNGYWLVGSDGGIFAYGDAMFFGSMGGSKLAKPVVGMTTARRPT